jgi:xylulokinase
MMARILQTLCDKPRALGAVIGNQNLEVGAGHVSMMRRNRGYCNAQVMRKALGGPARSSLPFRTRHSDDKPHIMSGAHCGIDIGSTNLKVVFLDDDGLVLKTLGTATPRVHDGIGPATDVMQLVDTLERLVIQGWRELHTDAPLASLACAGIGEDGVGLTAAGKPTGLAIPWFDKRATAEAARLARMHAELTLRTGHVIDNTTTAAKWLWTHHHAPAHLDEAQHWITVTDFPAAWWTRKRFLSCSLAPRTGCYDVSNRSWIAELLQAAHAPALPGILAAGDIVGGVQHGPLRESGAASSETLVVAGGHDHPVAASAIRRFQPHARVDSLGTANLIYGETTRVNHPAKETQLVLSLPPDGSIGLSCLGVIELNMLFSTLQEDPQDFHAFLSQGDFLRANHPLRDMCVTSCLLARDFLQALSNAGVPEGDVFSTGGWSRSRAYMTLRASIFGQPIQALPELELTAIGAALFGVATATGKAASTIRAIDIETIEPKVAWQQAFEGLKVTPSP